MHPEIGESLLNFFLFFRIMFPQMYNKIPSIRLESVKFYLNTGESLRKTAKKFGITYRTLFKWVKRYREKGEQGLISTYKRPWNRTPKEIEEKIALMKERRPDLSLRKAKKILEKQGFKISVKGIWNIWKRYALTGRDKSHPYLPFGPSMSEITSSLKKINYLLDRKEVESAARIVNSLPSFPQTPILKKIPEELLVPRRKLERLFLFFGEIPFYEYYHKARKLREFLEKNRFFYSSIFAGFAELVALHWMGSPEKELEIIKFLKTRIKNIHDPSLKYLIYMHEGIIYAKQLDYKNAKKCVKKCKKFLSTLSYPFFFDSIGALFSYIKDNKNATFYIKKALEKEKDRRRAQIFSLKLASSYAIGGRYKESIRLLKEAEKHKEGNVSSFYIISAYCAFGEGNILKAFSFLRKAIEKAERGEIRNHIYAACIGLASIKAALDDKEEAKEILNKYLPLFKKYKMEGEIVITSALLKEKLINKQFRDFSVFYLIYLLQNGKYHKALKFAKEKELLGSFHRYIVFFSHLVISALEKDGTAYLPKAILKFPVFNKQKFVYDIRFIGDFIIYRNHKYLHNKLGPKEKAFLIHLALKLPEPGKTLPLYEIYNNFWRYSRKPERNLTHLLSKLRKSLKIPSHLLEISKKRGLFINKGIYFKTDYHEFKRLLTQAHVFLKADEWEFAKKEYLSAFKLIRGEPFKKMYDRWSEDTRLGIIFEVEKVFIQFINECLKHGEKKAAQRIYEKAIKIIKYSDELKEKFYYLFNLKSGRGDLNP